MIAALDVGTTKITCAVAKGDGLDGMRVMGVGQEIAHGLKAGVVTDMERAEESIRIAVHRAEMIVDERVRQVFVSLSGGMPRSTYSEVNLDVGGREIDDGLVQRAFDEAGSAEVGDERDIVHAIATAYELDGNKGIDDPKGMYGETLRVRLHVVSVAHGALRNLLTCVRRCDLDIAAPVISAYASGLACLVEDELKLGVTLVDMGGGTTSIAAFSGGDMIWTDTLAVGGVHVTNDIARGLSTPLSSAERMKRVFGSAIGGPGDERETIEVPQLGESERLGPRNVPRSRLAAIVRPRIEEIFEMVRDRLNESGAASVIGRRVVLTGGASQLQGAAELASQILDKQVRLARPLSVAGLTQPFEGPDCSTFVGLLRYAVDKHIEPQSRRRARGSSARHRGGNPLGRIGQWLRENF